MQREKKVIFMVGTDDNPRQFEYRVSSLEKHLDLSIRDRDGVVVVTECSPESFEIFIRMVLDDKFGVDSAATALELIGVSEKFKCRSLRDAWRKCLSDRCRTDDVFLIYEYAHRADEQLAKMCLDHMKDNPHLLLGEQFHRASVSALRSICSDAAMAGSHLIVLVNALIRYAKARALNNGQSVEGVRTFIGPAVKKIPFLHFNVRQFAELEDIDRLLTRDEVFAIQKALHSRGPE